MPLHQNNKNMLPDSYFETGTIAHIVAGNKGRVLDGRRTPGFIESYNAESAMFIWRITDFEDKDNYWEIPAEEIKNYQFEKKSAKLGINNIKIIEDKCKIFEQKLKITSNKNELNTALKLITDKKLLIKNWLIEQSEFVKFGHLKLDITAKTGNKFLFNDLKNYLTINNLYELEKKTAEQYSLNPYSGEWIKGLKIVLAEMGLLDFNDKMPRTADIFSGIGKKNKRKNYIITRMAFVQAYLELAELNEIQLFRGMVTEKDNYETTKTIISASFNPNVAKEFSSLTVNDNARFSYFDVV